MTKTQKNQNTYSLVVLGLATLACFVSGCGREGAQGVAGSNGQSIVGPAGPQGSPGLNGSGVTVIKFCPGVTTYPSKFIEVGFCIGNKLYGTYSANGGFSTEIPPGSYGSNGINASCDFVVGPNCSIVN